MRIFYLIFCECAFLIFHLYIYHITLFFVYHLYFIDTFTPLSYLQYSLIFITYKINVLSVLFITTLSISFY